MQAAGPETQTFTRGPDRRARPAQTAPEHRAAERRQTGVNWIPLFRNLAPESVEAVLRGAEVVLLPAGTPLLKAGETNSTVYILLGGEVAAFLDTQADARAAIQIATGDCIGELSAIDGKPVSALVLALTDARVLKLSKEVFWNDLMTLPGIAGNLMVMLTERMRRTNEITLAAQREQLELMHLKKELDVARRLQASMLPLDRPLFPDRPEIELCGLMEPTDDVGGDLFDAFFVDDRHLFFCIGDVSGHGIASALFMARAIGLMRILAMGTLRPDELLTQLNDRLCVGNDTNLFVTLFCGFLEVRSRRMVYSNGGHGAPLLVSGGKAHFLEIPNGVLIGALEDMRYQSMERQLEPNDLLLCFTDGMTEAHDASGAEFSEESCRQLLQEAHGLPLPDLLDLMRQRVGAFTGSAALEDDCTMLAFRCLQAEVSPAHPQTQ
ncbi:MAG: SpoIIE family protein phosphatase [Rhodoferax sp.]|nr:SpoIIE family protein phosphatase [Rhodoferax sp.]